MFKLMFLHVPLIGNANHSPIRQFKTLVYIWQYIMFKRNTLRNLIAMAIIATFTCCKKNTEVPKPQPQPQLSFKKIYILGNSITLTPVNPLIGWNVARGMAASVPDSDYVHVLTSRFKKIEPTAEVTVKFFDDFEANYPTYDFEKLKQIRDSKPDLVIIRVGENVNQSKLDAETFKKRYQGVVQYLTQDNKQLVVLSVGPLWYVSGIDNAMQAYTPYVSLSTVSYDVTNFAFGLFSDPGVAQHPGDKGMRVIANIIWDKITEVNPYKNNLAASAR
jgi:hypothetical protein